MTIAVDMGRKATKTNKQNPAHDVTFQPKYTDLYESKPNFIKSFCVRTLPVLESANIQQF